MTEINHAVEAILDFWFGSMDDRTLLDREREPFRTHFTRWYGKSPEVDREIRRRFEAELERVTENGRSWDDTVRRWAEHRQGLLALTILLDQLPRNMYRDTPRMYARDALGLLVSERARALPDAGSLPLMQQMFLAVPLMHAESLTLQQRMLARFEGLVAQAEKRSPQNVGFYRFALDYAKRHVDVVTRFGRFPHRNAILGRTSSAEEAKFLESDEAYF